MEARAKSKDCDLLAHSQNCTKPEKFKYHCLMNEFINASIEVCAESYYIVSGRVETKYLLYLLLGQISVTFCHWSSSIAVFRGLTISHFFFLASRRSKEL